MERRLSLGILSWANIDCDADRLDSSCELVHRRAVAVSSGLTRGDVASQFIDYSNADAGPLHQRRCRVTEGVEVQPLSVQPYILPIPREPF